MAITYKDINLLSQKASVAGTEKLPVSDTQYITTGQLKDVFIAVFGTTTFQEVVTAYNAGKWIFCKLVEAPDVQYAPLTYMDLGDSATFNYCNGDLFSAVLDIEDNWTTNTSAVQMQLVSGTNIKTINNSSILGSGNLSVTANTSSCVHLTGDETIADDKTFTDNIAVVDADHIVYSGGGGSGFTSGHATQYISGAAQNSIIFTGLSEEPKAFVISDTSLAEATSGVQSIVGDFVGLHGVYNTGSQHNYSAGFTKSYSSGSLTITAPAGVSFASGALYSLVYYYGNGSLTFKTSTVQPGSGVTAVTFTGDGLTEVPAMYACFLESEVNNESYRRVSLYTNSVYDEDLGYVVSHGKTFLTGGPVTTTSSFSVSYNNGLYINSGGMNAGGYFHNPGTYTLYYLMASDVSGGGGYSSLGDELDAIRTDIGDIQTLLEAI